jgi:LysR family transcriptional regulator, nitrogen assimilation regulatory protein
MEIRQLRYFVKVVEASSLTRAAEQLHIAQPALSLQMQKLEEEVGEQLLVRHSRGIKLTVAGECLFTHAQRILEQLEAAQSDLRELRGELQGQVRIGMPRNVSQMLAVAVIENASRLMPKVQIGLVEHMSEHLDGLLAAGRLDMTFSYGDGELKRCEYEPVLLERLCLISPYQAWARPGAEIDFAELGRLPMILPSHPHALRKVVAETAEYVGIALNVIHEVDSVQTMAQMVEAGLGNTVLPFPAVEEGVANRRLTSKRIVRPEVTRRLQLVYPARQTATRAQMAVRKLLLELARRYALENAHAGLVELETNG